MTVPMKPRKPLVFCPKCQRKAVAGGPSQYHYCTHCKMQFDDSPDEGGDYGNNPERRLLRSERRR